MMVFYHTLQSLFSIFCSFIVQYFQLCVCVLGSNWGVWTVVVIVKDSDNNVEQSEGGCTDSIRS